MSDIIDRLNEACKGYPAAWPHRLLHDAISEIERLRGVAQAPRKSDEWELAQFLCEDLALESFDEVSRTKYLADAKAIREFLDVSPVSSTHQRETYCEMCDREHQLHEDSQGFHHVIKGERVTCPVSSTDKSGAA